MQTEVTTTPAVGVPGQLPDLQNVADASTRSVFSEEASTSIPFGTMVVRGTEADGVKLPAAQEDIPAGIVVFAQNYERGSDGVDGQLDANGLRPGVYFAVLRVGEILVTATVNGTAPGGEVHYQAEASATPLVFPIGCFRTSAESGKTVDLSPFASWESAGDAGDIVKLSIDLRNVALMASDA